MPLKLLPFGLHLHPGQLHAELQQAIDETESDVDVLLIGYGMCSKGAAGLEARQFRLVIPRMDDCIQICMGSRGEYLRQQSLAPGTFYLTGGWIECGDDPYTEYLKLRERYGHEKAFRLEREVIRHYTRLALIDTDGPNGDRYRAYARHVASFFGLAFEEISGTDLPIRKLIGGDWDDDFVVVEPGGSVTFDMFRC